MTYTGVHAGADERRGGVHAVRLSDIFAAVGAPTTGGLQRRERRWSFFLSSCLRSNFPSKLIGVSFCCWSSTALNASELFTTAKVIVSCERPGMIVAPLQLTKRVEFFSPNNN